jgi:trimeric autotransporter adhesin
MKTQPSRTIASSSASRLLLAAMLAAGASSLHAAAIIWDNGNTNQLWSDAVNWNPDSAASGNDISFAGTGAAAAGTTTNIVDANTSINSLLWSNTGGAASAQTTTINSGITLTVNGTTSPSVQVNSSTVASSVYAVLNGSGAFSVTGGSGVNFNVGQTNLGGSGTQTLDMAGLANFSANVGAMNLGNGQRNTAIVSLAASNDITATTIQLGGNATTGGPASTQFNLGTTNTIKADTLTVGSGRTGADMKFQTGLTGATLTLTNRAGSGATNLNIGLLDTNASGGPNSSLDLSGGTANLTLGTVTLGRGANSNAGGSSTGTLVFGPGTITATTMNIGNGNTGTTIGSTGNGVLTLNASAGTLTATTVTLGKLNPSNNRVNSANGTVNQNGGTATITTLTFADATSNGGTGGGNATGTYNLAGGTLKVGTIAAGTAGTGSGTYTYTRTFNWTGGTIQNLSGSSLTIGGVNLTTTGAGTQTFSADATRTITVNSNITGTGGFIKSGAGTVILNGTNSYLGDTVLNNGTLKLGASGSIGSSVITINGGSFDTTALVGGYTVASGQTIKGTGTYSGKVTVGAGATLAPGNSPGVVSFDNDLTLSGTTVMEINGTTRGTQYDGVDMTGTGSNTLIYGGTLTVSFGAAITAGTYDLFNLGSVGESGTFASVGGTGSAFGSLSATSITGSGWTASLTDISAGTWSLAFSNATGDLTIAAIPEPSTYAALAGLGMIGFAAYRRRRTAKVAA